MKRAVVLLSGGLDSATVLYLVRRRGYSARCLIFDYSQRHAKEVEAARKIARRARCSFKILKISLPWKASSLLDKRRPLPTSRRRSARAVLERKGIPSTYVPARNTIFLSFALSFAESLGARDIFIGVNSLDYSGYPDCRPDFYAAFNRLSRLATKAGVEHRGIKVRVPLIRMTKAGIVRLGMRLGVPFEDTWSCYQGRRRPCGGCDSCLLRAKGFEEAGSLDPSLKERA